MHAKDSARLHCLNSLRLKTDGVPILIATFVRNPVAGFIGLRSALVLP
jgi:hypothetical protein